MVYFMGNIIGGTDEFGGFLKVLYLSQKMLRINIYCTEISYFPCRDLLLRKCSPYQKMALPFIQLLRRKNLWKIVVGLVRGTIPIFSSRSPEAFLALGNTGYSMRGIS